MDDVGAHDVNGPRIVAALRNDEVGISLSGLDELLVHGLQNVQIAVDDHLCGASSLYGVALYDAYESFVRVGINEDPET